jgi:tripartite-type tricarboxylate transporter receptor subunit TctC
VPYRGDVLALQDVVGWQIDLIFDSAASSLPPARSGKIKVYAVMGKTRIAQAPEVPTVDEAGLPGFYMSVWLGLWAPKATPVHIIAKLNSAIVDTLADPSVQQRLAALGMEIFPREQPNARGASGIAKG